MQFETKNLRCSLNDELKMDRADICKLLLELFNNADVTQFVYIKNITSNCLVVVSAFTYMSGRLFMLEDLKHVHQFLG